MRQRLIWGAIVVGAIFFVVEFIVGEATFVGEELRLKPIGTELRKSISVMVTMAFGLGIINLFYVHGGNILRRRPDWGYSLAVFLTFTVVFIALIFQFNLDRQDRQVQSRAGDALKIYRDAYALDDPVARDDMLAQLSERDWELVQDFYEYQASYRFEPGEYYLQYVLNPLAQTVMGLLGFYITYAAYRAFRLRSTEASIMMVSAAIVIVGSDPIGGWLSVQLNSLFGAEWLNLPHLADLDNRVMNSGMQRGLWIGIHIAIIAVSLRILLGLERGMIEVRSTEEEA